MKKRGGGVRGKKGVQKSVKKKEGGGSKKKEGGLPGEPKSEKKETLPYKGEPSRETLRFHQGEKG